MASLEPDNNTTFLAIGDVHGHWDCVIEAIALASGGREPPPPALTGPDVRLSPHPAPTGRLSVTWEQLPVGE